jgi:hypothetical protein
VTLRSAAALAVLLVACLVPPSGAVAQGLPAWAPINPMAASRSPLEFEPFRRPREGWSANLALDYASAIEFGAEPAASYDLDAEILRLRLRVARDLSPSAFVELDGGIGGSYAGFLDGFLDWYHGLLGIELKERERRPHNSFLYRLALPRGPAVEREPSDIHLGDLRLAAGWRYSDRVQTVASIWLPTSTAPDGYGLGVVAGALVTTLHAPIAKPLVFEGSVGAGYAPTHGDLAEYQHTTFMSASSGLRWRFWGRQSLYANLFVHTPYYHDTTIRALDRRDMALDFGWILATRSGREWRLGLTEDLEPGGPGIDLVFRLGVGR